MDEALGRDIAKEWELDANVPYSKEEVIAALTVKIGQLMMEDTMGFIQLMYRLDIPEAQVDAALDDDNAAALIAQLVWDRQVQKYFMRKATPPPPSNRDEELDW